MLMVFFLRHGTSELFCNCLLIEEIPILLPSIVAYVWYSSPFLPVFFKLLWPLWIILPVYPSRVPVCSCMIRLLYTNATRGEAGRVAKQGWGQWTILSGLKYNQKEHLEYCQITAHLLEKSREQLYPRKNGWLDPCGGMLSVQTKT